jgi:transglutaminase-like putative cysteine protease
MMRYAVRHETSYGYRVPVDIGLHLLRLTPLSLAGQRPVSHSLTITPQPARIQKFRDHFGNAVHHVAVETAHDQFFVTLDAEVEVSRTAVSEDGPPWEEIRDAMRGDGFPVPPGVAEFVYPSPLAFPEGTATAYVLESFPKGRRVVPALRDLTARIHRDFTYTPNLTNVSTKVEEVLSLRQGVCQDFAHVMIACLRSLKLPARYVSGYVRSGGDFAGEEASHAWVSAWCPVFGWQDFDPTNNVMPRGEHFTVAWGRDYSDVTPVKGVALGGGEQVISVSVEVTPQQTEPRP